MEFNIHTPTMVDGIHPQLNVFAGRGEAGSQAAES
jgi:hypothetical protein